MTILHSKLLTVSEGRAWDRIHTLTKWTPEGFSNHILDRKLRRRRYSLLQVVSAYCIQVLRTKGGGDTESSSSPLARLCKTRSGNIIPNELEKLSVTTDMAQVDLAERFCILSSVDT